jgi:hypothetical protein
MDKFKHLPVFVDQLLTVLEKHPVGWLMSVVTMAVIVAGIWGWR